MFAQNAKVTHTKLGIGNVVADMGETVVVRFDSAVEVCQASELEAIPTVHDACKNKNISSLREFLVAQQAKCIKSVNDQWGVFARTKIELLPHQLWICRQARQKEPCRMLIADDVGLGKTIEAGIILSAFMSSGRIRRLLILTPASLAEQWQQRMFSMFDIRLSRYMAELDTKTSMFWQTNNMVVASLDTLRLDYNGRQDRLLAAEPWDLVIVDEAHHLNCDEKQGPTLGFSFVKKLLTNNKIASLLLFTGTPHKGHNFNFLSLMSLLDENVFDPKGNLRSQLPLLKSYMIRNNKYNVTDLRGEKLFSEPEVFSTPYSYSPEEQEFYDTLTEFISSGMAYASALNHGTGRVVMFVLITMQKLASSSVAAIRQALQRRVEKYEQAEIRTEQLKKELEILDSLDDYSLDDQRAQIEEELLELASMIQIAQNEKSTILALLELAGRVQVETKIKTILDVIEREYPDEQILFFTEYKATQAALMTSLMERYGDKSVTFINGDERLENVIYPDGQAKRISVKREVASKEFNSGAKRFLIATEAAGEGIDLQKRCHILFHVDLPWNPMRLHQRVGRLNRYGQKHKVIVRNFRNLATVESRIWDKLYNKLNEINATFSAVMEEKEDMLQLVLGMTSQNIFNNLFAYAPQTKDDVTLSQWFDTQTATLGGRDAYSAVQAISGNADKFDYRQVSNVLPHVDLPDLEKFWQNLLEYKGKKLIKNGSNLEFSTPDSWYGFGIMRKYDNLTFSRNPDDKQTILGVGHLVFNKALAEALQLNALVCVSKHIPNNILIYSLIDQVTANSAEKLKRIYACEISSDGLVVNILRDWELLQALNQLPATESQLQLPAVSHEILNAWESQGIKSLLEFTKSENNAPVCPVFTLEAILFHL